MLDVGYGVVLASSVFQVCSGHCMLHGCLNCLRWRQESGRADLETPEFQCMLQPLTPAHSGSVLTGGDYTFVNRYLESDWFAPGDADCSSQAL